MDNLDSLGLAPSVATQGTMQPRVLVASFGSGYEQRSQDGPNPGLRTWTVQWQTITKAKLGVLNAFFEAQGGWKKFSWTQPAPFDSEGAKIFVCEKWQWTYSGGDITGFEAELMQRPAV